MRGPRCPSGDTKRSSSLGERERVKSLLLYIRPVFEEQGLRTVYCMMQLTSSGKVYSSISWLFCRSAGI